MGQALGLVAPLDHDGAHEGDGLRPRGIQKEHGGRSARVEPLLAHAAKEVAHVHGDLTKVDVHRAGGQALVADRAVVGHIAKFFPVGNRHPTTGLLLVEEGLNEQRGGEDLVAG